MKLLELTPDLAISPTRVIAVQRNTLAKRDTCTVFLEGHGAHDGFTIDLSWEDTVDAISQALASDASSEEDHSPGYPVGAADRS
jgi:hypothetical protein